MTDKQTPEDIELLKEQLEAAQTALEVLAATDLEDRSHGQTELFKALAKAQAEFETVQATADNEYFRSKYAPLYALWEHARPILKKHGLVLIQEPIPSTIEEGAKLRNTLAHISGEWRSSIIQMPIDLGKEGKGKKAPAYGAAYSYGRRYGMGGILGLVTSAEDTDASTTDPDYDEGLSDAGKGWKGWAEFMCAKMTEATSRLDLEKLHTECEQRTQGQKVPDIVTDLIEVTYNRKKEELGKGKKPAGIDDIDPEGDIPQ